MVSEVAPKLDSERAGMVNLVHSPGQRTDVAQRNSENGLKGRKQIFRAQEQQLLVDVVLALKRGVLSGSHRSLSETLAWQFLAETDKRRASNQKSVIFFPCTAQVLGAYSGFQKKRICLWFGDSLVRIYIIVAFMLKVLRSKDDSWLCN